MRRICFLILLSITACLTVRAQEDFKFGLFSYDELKMTEYPQDSAASAVVLHEFGKAYIDSGNEYDAVLEYHVKIKILKTDGLSEGDFEIPLFKRGENEEYLRSVEASTFNLVNGSAVETKFDRNKIITDKVNKNWTYKKFALPNVRVGSVIEVTYKIESPYDFKFFPWEFQSHLPKIKSEFSAFVPANYIYNITLRGALELSKNESKRVIDCWTPHGNSADCTHHFWAMQNIPAFKKEEYMTAPVNFISAIHFELSEFKDFYGQRRKYTEEWKNVDAELRRHERFGVQLRRGKDVVDAEIEAFLLTENDPLKLANKIYDFIKRHYGWDGRYSSFTDVGVRKAFEERKGNVAEINMALIAALRYAKLDADPLMLSTREHGLPTELHPVLTEFNYVVAKLNIGDKVYLLDATEDHYPFGVLPLRCMNGKGRVIDDERESYWFDIKPVEKSREIAMVYLKVGDDGSITGNINKTYSGYAAIDLRSKIKSFGTHKEYIQDFDKDWTRGNVKSFTIENVDDITKPITEKLEVEIESIGDLKAPTLFFNPFVIDKREENPFKSKERLYPVDYGYSNDKLMILTLELPPSMEISEVPTKLGLALPNAGGRFLYDVQVKEKTVVVNSSLSIAKPVFSAQEYHYIKELYDRILQVQNADLVLKVKK